jgi:hypothetical protein
MRDSTARCSVTLLAIFLIVLAFASMELVSPTRVDCREFFRFSEDCGDPDMPDCATGGVGEVTGTLSGSTGTEESPEHIPCTQHEIQLEKADKSAIVLCRGERMAIVLRLWASIASKALAF